jgi:hypothetical protein
VRPSEYLHRRCPACFGNLQHDPSEMYVHYPAFGAPRR